MADQERQAGNAGVAGSGRVTAEPITLAQLAAVLEGQISWIRVYLDWRHEQSRDLMNRDAIREFVRAYGDRQVKGLYPGYRFVMVYLES